MNRTLTLARIRRTAYVGTQRAYAPLLTALVLVLVARVSGSSEPDSAYAFSAALLFAVFAWQAKAVLDTEPDEQRMLGRLAVGSADREIAAGLLAPLVPTLPILLAALVAPLLGALLGQSGEGLLEWVGFGLWIHLISMFSGTAVGALTSRAVISSRAWAISIQVLVFLGVLVLGSRPEPFLRWWVPQLVDVSGIDLVTGLLISVHAMAWSGIVFLGYVRLRRRRA